MKTDLSRRSFLFGSAALLVAASAPAIIPAAWTVEDWTRREIYGINFTPEAGPQSPGPDEYAALTVFRRRLKDVTPTQLLLGNARAASVPALLLSEPAATALLCAAVNRRGSWRWTAMYGPPLIFLPEHALDLTVDRAFPTTVVEINGTDYFADGTIEPFVEIYRWPGPSKERHSMDVRGRYLPEPIRSFADEELAQIEAEDDDWDDEAA